MVYVSRSGEIKAERGLVRTVVDFFKSIYTLIVVFFSTLSSMEASKVYVAKGRESKSFKKDDNNDRGAAPKFRGMGDFSAPGAGGPSCGRGG